MELTLKYVRSVKHSHFYKAVDGTNIYIKKEHFEGAEKPPETLIVLDEEEYDTLRDGGGK